jgi:hypothetical protein
MINGRAISHTDPLTTEAWSVPTPHGTPTCRSLSPGPLQTHCGRPLALKSRLSQPLRRRNLNR